MTASTHAHAPHLPATAEEATRVLMTQWPHSAFDLRSRRGNDPRYPNGGHNIAENPKLLQTVDDIAAGYFELFYEQTAQKSHRNSSANRNHDGRAQVHQRTTLYTRESCKKLVEECGLEVKDATAIIGAIIQRAIRTYRAVYNYGSIGVMNSALNNIGAHCQARS